MHGVFGTIAVLSLVLLLTALALAWAPPACAQDSSAPDSLMLGSWRVNLTGALAGSQAAYRNWEEGGLSALSISSTLNGTATRSTRRWEQEYTMRLAFGLLYQEEQSPSLRKSADLVRLRSRFQYRGQGFFSALNPTLAGELRTQFAKGFNYNADPVTLTSEFFAPAFITQSLGLTYQPAEWFYTRLGVATKETVVLRQRLRSIYGLSPGSAARLELGTESATGIDKEIFDNVQLQSTLSLFTAFDQRTFPDATWENYIIMQVNSWLSTQLEFVALFDEDTTDAIQIKEVLSVGVSFVLV